MEPTVQSIKGHYKNVPYPHIKVTLNNLSYYIEFDPITRWRGEDQLGHRWVEALKKNLKNKLVLEKNFCFLGFADSKRNIDFLCNELNNTIFQINRFNSFNHWGVNKLKSYKIDKNYTPDDFIYSADLPTGLCPDGDEMSKPGLRLKHDTCNELHRYFEDLQGQAWDLSPYYKIADYKTKYAIRQLNNLCHEIEGWVQSNRKKIIDTEWMRPSQITTFLHAPRYELQDNDFDLFKLNRYDRELGGVYLHWSQIGKTLFEVFRDGDKAVGDGGITHQRYYSGEFDIEWGQTITEDDKFKKEEMEEFRTWLKDNNYDWEDPKLALGYIKLGQVDLKRSFGTENFLEIYKQLSNNLNITKIEVIEGQTTDCDYSYSLESPNWQQIQIESLKKGYESHSLR
jgi:hypothetical protein